MNIRVKADSILGCTYKFRILCVLIDYTFFWEWVHFGACWYRLSGSGSIPELVHKRLKNREQSRIRNIQSSLLFRSYYKYNGQSEPEVYAVLLCAEINLKKGLTGAIIKHFLIRAAIKAKKKLKIQQAFSW